MSVSVSVCTCTGQKARAAGGLQDHYLRLCVSLSGSPLAVFGPQSLGGGVVWCGEVWAPSGRGEGTRSLGAAAPAALGKLGAGCVLARRRAHRALAHSLPAASSAGHLA